MEILGNQRLREKTRDMKPAHGSSVTRQSPTNTRLSQSVAGAYAVEGVPGNCRTARFVGSWKLLSTFIAPSIESRPDYGIDAPGIRRGMLIAGGVGLTVAVLANLVGLPPRLAPWISALGALIAPRRVPIPVLAEAT